MARTIPGLHTAAAAVAKKSPRSLRVDSRFWCGENKAPETRTKEGALQKIAAIAAPTPFCAPDRILLAKGILADFGVVFLSLAVVHIPLCCGGSGWNQPGAAIRSLWIHLRSSDLGLALIYAALITLLAYSERFPATVEDPGAWARSACKAIVWASLVVFAAIALSGAGTMTPAMLVESALLNFLGMLSWRLWANRQRRLSGSNFRNVLVVGGGRLGREVAESLGKMDPPRVFKGFLDQSLGGDPKILGTVENLPEVARSQFADEVIVALPHDRALAQTAVLTALRNHLDVRVVPDLFGCSPDSLRIGNIGGLPLISLHEESVPQLGLINKRILDCVGAVLALLALAPLFLLSSVLIKLDSPGPIFYLGERVGRKGRRFLCCKFRTMTCDADASKSELRSRNERLGPIFKIANDPRITRLGRFLRRYSVDELPQLWNVLKGEMSLVGPRPHPVDDFAGYQLHDLRRLDMTPGLTGLWQVTARRDPSFQTSMALDLEYIDKWSLWLDLRILLKTIPVVLAGTGA